MRTTGALALMAALSMTAGCSNGHGDAFEVRGTLTLNRGFSELGVTDGQCTGALGFDDVRPGASVTVLDSGDKKLAVGHLSPGRRLGPAQCRFRFSLDDVPGGDDVYSVRVASRKDFDFSPAEADSLHLELDYR